MKPAILLSALALAACGGEPTVTATNASGAEVAAQVDAATGGKALITPGRWETSVKIEDVSMPGMPPEVAAQMKQGHMMANKVVSCITPEQANRPRGELLGGDGMKGCTYESFRMEGGTIAAKARCEQQGVTQTMAMDGTYGGDSYEMRMATDAASTAGPMGGMKMTMRVTGKRVGACDGTEANSKAKAAS